MGSCNSLFQHVIYIIPTIIYTLLQNIFETWYKIPSEDGPLYFGKDIVMAWHKAVLKCIRKAWVKAMMNHGMRICDAIVFSARITLRYDRNT